MAQCGAEGDKVHDVEVRCRGVERFKAAGYQRGVAEVGYKTARS